MYCIFLIWLTVMLLAVICSTAVPGLITLSLAIQKTLFTIGLEQNSADNRVSSPSCATIVLFSVYITGPPENH